MSIESFIALGIGIIIGKILRGNAESQIQTYYSHLAISYGFIKRTFIKNWKSHNQTLANRIVTSLVGFDSEEFDEKFFSQIENKHNRKNLHDRTDTNELLTHHCKVLINSFYACRVIHGGNISLYLAGELVSIRDHERLVLRQVDPQFAERDDTFRKVLGSEDIDLKKLEESELFKVLRIGYALRIHAMWEGKRDW